MFIGAHAGEGATSMAASFALMAAERVPRTAWLVDLDFRRNHVYRGFEEEFGARFGKPGRAFDASLGKEPIYTISPDVIDRAQGAKLLTAHQISGTRLLVTRFRNERLRQGQKVELHTRASWWDALRRATDFIVVDAPAIDRSSAGLAVASQMDGVVLVISADKTSVEDVAALRLEVEAHGGKVLGVVMNRMRADARLADRLI